MTEKDVELLRKQLLKQRHEIFARLKDLDEGWLTLSEHDIEMSDEAQKAELTELYGRLDQRDLEQVEEIDRALGKIAASEYGTCEDCGQLIPLARLKALPATRYCVDCSEEHSKGG